MKILVDTTYLLPAVGVSVRGLPRDLLLKLLKSDHPFYISEIAIFELLAKSAKYIVEDKLGVDRASRGVRSIVYDERIEKIPIYDTPIMQVAFRLRRLLSDFIDCIVTSSAINLCDVLITEDRDIRGLKEKEGFREILEGVNPKFRIYAAKEFERKLADERREHP